MRAILYWYVRVLEYIAIPAIAVLAFLGVGLWTGVLVISSEYLVQANAWANQNLMWLSIAAVVWSSLGVAACMNSDYSAKPGQRTLSNEYKRSPIFGLIPPALLLVILNAISYSVTSEPVGVAWGLLSITSVIGGAIGGVFSGWLLRAFIRPSWQKENIDALKEKAAEALRMQGAFMPNEVETAFKGRSYDEVYELNRQCETIGSLTEKQTHAYNSLMETMKGYGVNVSTGAAFSNKSAAELLAEQKDKADDT